MLYVFMMLTLLFPVASEQTGQIIESQTLCMPVALETILLQKTGVLGLEDVRT